MKKFKVFSLNLIFLIFIFSIIEVISFFLIKSSNDSFTRENIINDKVRGDWNIEFHPGVGISHALKDFKNSPNSESSISKNILFTEKVYGNKAKKDDLKILTLGGSTTDALGNHFSGNEGTWPDHLGLKLSKKLNQNIRIYNAGVGAATSSQESIRLFTLLNYLSPDYILSLNGINELYFLDDDYIDPNNYYASRTILGGLKAGYIIYQGKNYASSLKPTINKNINYLRLFLGKNSNIYFLLSKIKRYNSPNLENSLNYKLDKLTTNKIHKAASYWENNIINMYNISKLKNRNYFVILQPTFGLDMKNQDILKLQTKTFFAGKEKIFPTTIANSVDTKYLRKINYLYLNLRKICKGLNFCIDLSNNKNLNTNQLLYADSRHLNKEGNNLLSQEIKKVIFKKYYQSIK